MYKALIMLHPYLIKKIKQKQNNPDWQMCSGITCNSMEQKKTISYIHMKWWEDKINLAIVPVPVNGYRQWTL